MEEKEEKVKKPRKHKEHRIVTVGTGRKKSVRQLVDTLPLTDTKGKPVGSKFVTARKLNEFTVQFLYEQRDQFALDFMCLTAQERMQVFITLFKHVTPPAKDEGERDENDYKREYIRRLFGFDAVEDVSDIKTE